ncbi:hypothetical protein [Ferroplasma sp.]|uniref:hypothetical protein n=1 Tax=Ferroplasma sp. TaxID=2591003 RepID=UPI002628CFF0|nr:hypothetical protein [Ferroplasma sp.]
MKTYFLIILALFSISSCHGRNYQVDEACGKQISKALGHVNNFYFTKRVAYLDSALQILKGVENCSPKYTNIIFMDEVQVYFFKKDFTSALITLNKVPASVFPFPTFRDIYEYKIKAKEAETKGDTINQKKDFRAIILIYQRYIDENHQLFTNTLCQPECDKIDNTQVDFILTELYYYIVQVEGINDAISKIEKYQNEIKGNSSYFDELARSIKKNDAKAMGILLY